MVRRKGHSFDGDFGRQLRLGVVQRGFELFKCVKGEWILEWRIAFVEWRFSESDPRAD